MSFESIRPENSCFGGIFGNKTPETSTFQSWSFYGNPQVEGKKYRKFLKHKQVKWAHFNWLLGVVYSRQKRNMDRNRLALPAQIGIIYNVVNSLIRIVL